MSVSSIDLRTNIDRVLNRPFIPASPDQVSNIIERVLSFSDPEVEAQLACLRDEFAHRHPNLEKSWLRPFEKVAAYFSNEAFLPTSRRLLIGAFFTGEYAVAYAALFNPSIVPHPDQTDFGAEDLRFILTLRAIGEGHISSIEFRSGVVRSDHSIEMDHATDLVTAPDIEADPTFSRNIFLHKLQEKGLENNWSRSVMNRLGATFTRTELDESLQHAAHQTQRHSEDVKRAIECLHWLVNLNYEGNFNLSPPLSQRVIFPVSLNESNGIEDARFVRFVDEDAPPTYYATYTAYDGRIIRPQLI